MTDYLWGGALDRRAPENARCVSEAVSLLVELGCAAKRSLGEFILQGCRRRPNLFRKLMYVGVGRRFHLPVTLPLGRPEHWPPVRPLAGTRQTGVSV